MERQEGAIHVPAFDLLPSAALSPEARAQQIAQAAATASGAFPSIPRLDTISDEVEFRALVIEFREKIDAQFGRPFSDALLSQYPVEIEEKSIGGVPVEIFTPPGGGIAGQILINLHGGAFCAGAKYIGRVESIPLCHIGGWKIVSVDYRQGFEHKFPTASEDVAAVFTALLEEYPAGAIGLYGGSAGGILTGQATAWLIEHGQPVPGAIGMFGAGTGGSGDASYFYPIANGQPPPLDMMLELRGAKVGYFSETNLNNPLMNPIKAPVDFRAKFPPALLITGTRAFDLSPAIATHRALCQAGVDASLHVFDGVGHCFYYNVQLPEGQDAYATVVRFFREKLTTKV